MVISSNLSFIILSYMQQKEHFKYRIMAHVLALHLNKNLNFETKVTWKRNVNKTETQSVVHQDCISTFDETLELELNLVFNHQDSKFESKLTQFAIVVIYQGKLKSGGSVRYDVADVINNNYNNETVRLKLNQCPDPEAYLEVVFDYQTLGDTSRSLFNELSMLNPSGFEQDLSQIDFKDDEPKEKQSEKSVNPAESEKQNIGDLPLREKELYKIHNILDKFESVTRKIASVPKPSKQDQNQTKLSLLQISVIPTEAQLKLQNKIAELESDIEMKAAIIEDYEKKLEQSTRVNEQLQLRLELASEKIKQLENNTSFQRIDSAIIEQEQHYRELYQQVKSQLEEMKSSNDINFSKHKNFNAFFEEVHKIEETPQFQVNLQHHPAINEKIDELERINVELQTKIAMSTHNVAQLFNAAYDYGGAKLLDYLQNSIGLIERQQ